MAEQVIVRAKDFARRSPRIAKQLKAYLESPDRKDPALKSLVPAILVKLPREVLRVCEAAVQLDFMNEFDQDCMRIKIIDAKNFHSTNTLPIWQKS